MTMDKSYRIDWAVELTATSPNEAACFASEIQEQSQNTATVFSVTDKQTGQITVHDLAVDGARGTNFPARRPADTQSARSLRPGREYRTRSGLVAQVMDWNGPDDWPLFVRIGLPDGCYVSGSRNKFGGHPQGSPHPLDVLEVNATITKWVRVYDAPQLNEKGKQVVSGKEFAAERALHWYLFDTEEEARANLRGVRAVFPIEYEEGQGLGEQATTSTDLG